MRSRGLHTLKMSPRFARLFCQRATKGSGGASPDKNGNVDDRLTQSDVRVSKEWIRRIRLELRSHKVSGVSLQESVKKLHDVLHGAGEKEALYHHVDMVAAYVTSRAPGTFAANLHVLRQLQRWWGEDRNLQSMMDFGAGPAVSIAAAFELSLIAQHCSVHAVEPSPIMHKFGLCWPSLPRSGKDIQWVRSLSELPPTAGLFDLVTASYSIGEIPVENRERVLEQLWARTRYFLVLVEPGSRVGFEVIAEARDKLLSSGHGEAFVVAPCLHDRNCPLLSGEASTNSGWFCHFIQRLERTDLHRYVKSTGEGTENERFAYVILSRASAETVAERSAQWGGSWARVLASPIKRRGHVLMDGCTKHGTFERWAVAKSHGESAYSDARRARWGDLLRTKPAKGTLRSVAPALKIPATPPGL